MTNRSDGYISRVGDCLWTDGGVTYDSDSCMFPGCMGKTKYNAVYCPACKNKTRPNIVDHA